MVPEIYASSPGDSDGSVNCSAIQREWPFSLERERGMLIIQVTIEIVDQCMLDISNIVPHVERCEPRTFL